MRGVDEVEPKERIRLTKRFADSVRFADRAPAGAGRVIVYDGDLPGFGLRLMKSGLKFYIVQYRNAHNRQRRMTIGRHGKITAEEAREIALNVFTAVRAGKDPLVERQVLRKAPSMGELLDRYMAQHVEKNNRASTQVEVRRIVDLVIRPKLGARQAAAVTREDMDEFHKALSATPRQANYALAICSKAFSLAEVWRLRPDGSNPCRRVERFDEVKRKRFLSGAELVRLGATLRLAETDGLPWHVVYRKSEEIKSSRQIGDLIPAKPDRRRTRYARVTIAAVELLLFTGCRLSEVLGLKWSDVDLPGGIISLPITKSGVPQSSLITAPARLVLLDLKRVKGPGAWVLPSTVNPKLALTKSALEQAWQRIRVAAGIPDVRLHDLRHTVGTYAGQSGANAFMIRDLLRHGDLAITDRYVSRDDGPLRTLSEMVSDRIAAGLAGKGSAEVVPLRRKD
jgi:integrase